MCCLGSLFGAYTGIFRVVVEIIFNMVNPVIIVYDFADIFDVLICGCVAVYARSVLYGFCSKVVI